MNSPTERDDLRHLANATAEGVLRAIYGDDFTGCTVRLEAIASIIYDAMEARSAADRGLLDLYAKTSEALIALTTPPPNGRELAPAELQSLLGSRLDAIRNLVEKVTAIAEKLNLGSSEQSG